VPSNSFLFEYYSDSFTYQSEYTDITPDYDENSRIDTIKKYVSNKNKIVEFGSNTGKFVQALEQNGFEAEGIDPIDYESEEVTTSFVGENTTWDSTYDALVSYYTLEHVTNTNTWLDEAITALSEEGIIILEVPDFQQHPEQSLINEHFSHFTPAHLQSLLKNHNVVTLDINKQDTSRYFGFEIVGKYVSNLNEKPSFEDHWNTSEAIECYEEGQRKKKEKHHLHQKIARKIKDGINSNSTCVYFWGANDYATGIANNLELENQYIIDNDSSKIGTKHPGFSTPIKPPEFETNTGHHRIFVLCSPAWNSDITNQIDDLGLKDITIIDGTKYQNPNQNI
jgi:2-polyprenyl-3-methyl-5-hydroxy-6-metoxy-1,4-benzoquinol methylase